MERIKAVFNWSGGKDSAHALLRAMRSGKYEIVTLLTTINRDTRRSVFRIIKRDEQNPDILCLTTIQPSMFSDIVVSREQVSGLWRVVVAVCGLCR